MPTQTKSNQERIADAIEKKHRLELAAGAMAVDDLHKTMAHGFDMLKAEDRAVMRAWKGGDAVPGDEVDDMGIVLGDNVTTITSPERAASTFSRFAGQALLAAAIGGPASAVAWKYLERPVVEAVEPVTAVDQDTVVGLRLFSDGEE